LDRSSIARPYGAQYKPHVGTQLNDPPPQVSAAEAMSGYAGDSIVIQGANFSTLGGTQVFFDSAPSPSVTCATSTECTAVVPTALAIPNATSHVTVDGGQLRGRVNA
jgi:hypothetical protein